MAQQQRPIQQQQMQQQGQPLEQQQQQQHQQQEEKPTAVEPQLEDPMAGCNAPKGGFYTPAPDDVLPLDKAVRYFSLLLRAC
jgi:hypothetical protein